MSNKKGLLDNLLHTRGYNRYRFSKDSGISESVLQNINNKTLSKWTFANVELIATKLGLRTRDLISELMELGYQERA
ncbi:MAG: helix-turn-helix transcriptional regulator [Streptococcaceae bacterium]|jgi:DNA-binding Xre family transcriptional regulator|nr:helix-turn-helix transcriptional regulator [Streptococcaceae bacterium]